MFILNFYYGVCFIRFFVEIFWEFEEFCCGVGFCGVYDFVVSVLILCLIVIVVVFDEFVIFIVYWFCIGLVF